MKAEDFTSHLVRNENGCLEWGRAKTKGYGSVWIDGVWYQAHIYAWRRSFGDIPAGLMVCHTCDNGLCCEETHLFLGTHQDNMDDMVRKGRQSKVAPHKGEESPSAVLTEDDVLEIRRLCAEGNLNQIQIGVMFGIEQAQVSRIHRRVRWKHLP